MRLIRICSSRIIFLKSVKNIIEIFFSDISFDSKKIKKNNIFFAIKGNKIDGNNFIKDAIRKGSKVIVTEKKKKNLKMEFYILLLKIFENY